MLTGRIASGTAASPDDADVGLELGCNTFHVGESLVVTLQLLEHLAELRCQPLVDFFQVLFHSAELFGQRPELLDNLFVGQRRPPMRPNVKPLSDADADAGPAVAAVPAVASDAPHGG